MLPPKLILSPVDFSDFARGALDVAADMASHFGATLLLVYVVPAVADLPRGVSILKEGEYERESHEAASQRLLELAATLANKNITVRTEVGTANDVGMELVRIAEQDHVDLIVIATHGMTGWRLIPFGSVTKKVVEEAACPVLVLRAKAADQAAESPAHSSTSSATAS
jgi:nucleotide-binding universal stress UspA family protein